MDIKAFWRAVLAQDEPEIRTYFAPDAYVNWHCTNEHFTVDEFITANCEYPGEWDGVVERIETLALPLRSRAFIRRIGAARSM